MIVDFMKNQLNVQSLRYSGISLWELLKYKIQTLENQKIKFKRFYSGVFLYWFPFQEEDANDSRGD